MAAPARLQATAHEVIMTDLHMFVYTLFVFALPFCGRGAEQFGKLIL